MSVSRGNATSCRPSLGGDLGSVRTGILLVHRAELRVHASRDRMLRSSANGFSLGDCSSPFSPTLPPLEGSARMWPERGALSRHVGVGPRLAGSRHHCRRSTLHLTSSGRRRGGTSRYRDGIRVHVRSWTDSRTAAGTGAARMIYK